MNSERICGNGEVGFMEEKKLQAAGGGGRESDEREGSDGTTL